MRAIFEIGCRNGDQAPFAPITVEDVADRRESDLLTQII
jgi:hypothetical protein